MILDFQNQQKDHPLNKTLKAIRHLAQRSMTLANHSLTEIITSLRSASQMPQADRSSWGLRMLLRLTLGMGTVSLLL